MKYRQAIKKPATSSGRGLGFDPLLRTEGRLLKI
jgi:hypothetical protein